MLKEAKPLTKVQQEPTRKNNNPKVRKVKKKTDQERDNKGTGKRNQDNNECEKSNTEGKRKHKKSQEEPAKKSSKL